MRKEIADLIAKAAGRELQKAEEEKIVLARSDRKRYRRNRLLRMYQGNMGRVGSGPNAPPFADFMANFPLEPLCKYCQREGMDWKEMHLEHNVPISRGGAKWDLANLDIACCDCNMIKGVLTGEEFKYLCEPRLLEFYAQYGKKA